MFLDGLIDKLFSNMMALMPFVIVKSYEQAVRWKWGRNPEALGPGPHWRVYLWHSVDILTTVDDAMMLPTQSVITKDEKLVCFRASFTYRVKDVVAHCCNVTDFQTSTITLACQHLARKVRERTLAELTKDLSKIEDSLKGTLTTRFKDWGTDVLQVGFIDFAEVPTQLRIFGDHGPLDHLSA